MVRPADIVRKRNNIIYNKSMDREIPKEVRQKERNKKLIRYGVSAAAVIVVISVLISVMRTGVKEKDVVFSTVDRGTIEVSVSASGKVVPAFEEIINSPINTRIVPASSRSIRKGATAWTWVPPS